MVVGVVVFFTALNATQTISAPAVLAIVSGIIVSPVSDRLDALGLPRAFAALLSFLFGIASLVLLFVLFQPAVIRAVDAFPRVYAELNATVYEFQREFRGLQEVEQEVREMVDPGNGNAPEAEEETPAESAADAIPTVEEVVFLAPAVLGQVLIYLGTFFFFVLTRTRIYEFVARRLATPQDRPLLAQRLRSAERQVARYFLTISAINLGLGVTVAVTMASLGLPSPILWGVAAFALNYLMYAGPAALVAALLIAGAIVFDGLMSFVPAGVFIGLNALEGQFVTPALLGRSLSVNPLLIFLTVAFFLWLWGPMGAIVAIPLLLWAIAIAGISMPEK